MVGADPVLVSGIADQVVWLLLNGLDDYDVGLPVLLWVAGHSAFVPQIVLRVRQVDRPAFLYEYVSPLRPLWESM